MAISFSSVDICNAALDLVGATRISSLISGGGTKEARICSLQYDLVVRDTLQVHPWRFSLLQFHLNIPTGEDPIFGFRNCFVLPSDFLRIIGIDQPQFEYEIRGDRLYADVSDVKVTYQARVLEGNFPAYFVRVIVYDLAKILAYALVEDSTKGERFEKLKLEQLLRAQGVDSQGNGRKKLPAHNFSLINSRL